VNSRAAGGAATRRRGNLRAILYSLGANIAIAAAKLVGAIFTGSGSLLAEAFHSIADSGNEGLLLLGRKQARAPPSAIHPLGHGRATYFWAFIVALLLFSVGGIASIYEGVGKLRRAESLETPLVAVAIILFAAVAEAVSLYVALKEINQQRGTRSLWRWFRESRRSELIVLFGENAAALAGLGIALAAVLLSMVTGDSSYDAMGSIAVGALLMVVAVAMSAEIKSLLIGESASPRVRRAVRAFLLARPEIHRISSLVTLQHGEDLVVAVKAQMRAVGSSGELVDAIERCESDLKAAFPQVRWVFFEPAAAARAQR
jgi:cation diffusion facilitator family transporter